MGRSSIPATQINYTRVCGSAIKHSRQARYLSKRFIQAIRNKQPSGATSSRTDITQQDRESATLVDTQQGNLQPVSCMVHITLDSGLQNPDAWWIHHSMPCRYVGWLGPWEDTEGCHAGGLPPPAPPRLPAPYHSCFVDHTQLGILIPVSRQSCMDAPHNTTTGIAHGATVYIMLGSGHSVGACMACGSITHTEHAARGVGSGLS